MNCLVAVGCCLVICVGTNKGSNLDSGSRGRERKALTAPIRGGGRESNRHPSLPLLWRSEKVCLRSKVRSEKDVGTWK
ncbi:hypothetical protein BDP55DRAFT_51591 [Colletotrichum godetiae]|uniref:Secreted protein n=1 Tax=Colletotrichum godetiae TaxID=1209918 RepID=A0AAJ0AQT1_9PEZI|nr:uncharacterized protein BDP55DRAFT_51591 [Colletotrichum godetiae]KAK1688653.1 hypothetical protein BDP55DRAFT_51591 [Colletotrichum godetiae]